MKRVSLSNNGNPVLRSYNMESYILLLLGAKFKIYFHAFMNKIRQFRIHKEWSLSSSELAERTEQAELLPAYGVRQQSMGQRLKEVFCFRCHAPRRHHGCVAMPCGLGRIRKRKRNQKGFCL